MTSRQTVIVVICVVVIVAAVFALVGKQVAKPKAPERVLQTKVRCIGVETGELVEMTLGEWEKVEIEDPDKGYRKFEGYTVARAMDCPVCDKPIPVPTGEPPFKCPKCGGEL